MVVVDKRRSRRTMRTAKFVCSADTAGAAATLHRRMIAIDARSPIHPPAHMRIPRKSGPIPTAPALHGRNRTDRRQLRSRASLPIFPAAHRTVYFVCIIRK
ncbi:hypothetical protein [Burkholderia pseudomultivorans]|uniref:hypothetical protein n=1 Tax=Burkholderia pseudomultivorans TaxID=1207504 RepID=UPI0012D944A5|nr:hypothetical protein [Burkholderia pseudomultivorans]